MNTIYVLMALCYFLAFWLGAAFGYAAACLMKTAKESEKSGPVHYDEPMPWMEEKR